MFSNRSPPKHTKKLIKGGSSNALLSSVTTTSPTLSLSSTTSSNCSSASAATTLTPLKLLNSGGNGNSSTCRAPTGTTASTLSLYSNSSTNALLTPSSSVEKQHGGLHYHHSHAHSHQHSHHSVERSSGGGGSSSVASGRNSLSSNSTKRGKKQNWGARDRAGMSFLIVIAFFAVFGLIILTEIFMIDERSHGGMMVLRHGGSFSSRLGDSMPDYDNVKDDYDVLDDSLLSDNKLGYVQFRDNKLKIQDVDNNDALAAGHLAGVLLKSAGGGVSGGTNGFGGGGGAAAAGAAAAGAAVGAGNNVPLIPWGKVLPIKIEETLPHYPFGTQPTDGSWQVVNGTRFKFFVFSAYYDRRDGAKLVRVIGATKTRGPERVWCRFWYPMNRTGSGAGGGGERYTSATVMARVKVIRENWNLKYSACFILCPVRTPELDVPHYVSIVARLRAPPGNLLELRNTDWDADFAASGNHTTHNASSSSTRKSRFLSMALTSRAAVTARPPTLPTGEQIADKIAVCVKPFHFNYDQALYLMEYLEFYALLGVAHFTFYNHTIGPHATCVLQHYMSGDIPDNLTAWDDGVAGKQQAQEGAGKTEAAPTNNNSNNNNNNSNGSSHSSINNTSNSNTQAARAVAGSTEIETGKETKTAATKKQAKHYEKSTNYIKPTVNILPWNLRMRSQKEIRTEGLFAALNDCLYRTMYRYKYLALVDLDEFIVPRHNDTLNELINSLNQRFRNRNMGAYSFQNAFFYLQFPDDPLAYSQTKINVNDENSRLRAALVTQRKTRRRFKLHPQKQRSKYICKPEAVVEAGNHFVWEFSPGKGSLNVPPTDAILQHYRVCEFGGNDCIKAPSVIDRTATKYVNRLMQRVDTVYRHLKKPCDLPELPVLPSQQEEQKKAERETRRKSNEVNKQLQRGIKNSINDETNMNNEENEEYKRKEIENETKTIAAITTTTTNTTIKEKAKATNTNATTNSAARPMNKIRKKRKMISFDDDENGVPCARVEYV